MSEPPRRWIDLHTHSTASDGAYPPAKLMELAAARGLAAVALTDHDTTAGLAEASHAAARLGIEFVPAIELEAQEGRYTLHVLGYFIDPDSRNLVELLQSMRGRRHARNEQIVARLRGMGIEIDYEQIKRDRGDAPVGRPHLADALIRAGTVSSFRQAFHRYLGEGAAAYVARERVSAGDVIGAIRAAGGVAGVAHPSRITAGSELELLTLFARLSDRGLAAIEVRHPDHSPQQEEAIGRIARRLGLAVTGGSDFHRLAGIVRGTGFWKRKIPYEWLEDVKAASSSRD